VRRTPLERTGKRLSVPEPVVAVFDVVTSSSNIHADTHPVLLLHPRPRLQDLFPTKYQKLTGIEDRTVVGRIGNSLFAMGNVNFPLVNIAQLPDELLAIEPGKDKGRPNTLSTATRCRDLFCFLGVRLTKRDDASSLLSRLLDSPEHLHLRPWISAGKTHYTPMKKKDKNYSHSNSLIQVTTSSPTSLPLPKAGASQRGTVSPPRGIPQYLLPVCFCLLISPFIRWSVPLPPLPVLLDPTQYPSQYRRPGEHLPCSFLIYQTLWRSLLGLGVGYPSSPPCQYAPLNSPALAILVERK